MEKKNLEKKKTTLCQPLWEHKFGWCVGYKWSTKSQKKHAPDHEPQWETKKPFSLQTAIKTPPMINKMTNHRNTRMTWQNDSCILQHALHPTHWTLGSTKSWLNNTTCRSEMFGTLITLTNHKCETAMHDKARITWQNDGHHQPPPIPHNRQNLWNGSTTANHMPQLMNRDGCSAGQTQHHNSQIWNVKKPTQQLWHCMQK